MSAIDAVKNLIGETLQIEDKASGFTRDTPLLGHIPELDSMAVIPLITGIESHFGITIDDDEISADTFESVGTLTDFVDARLA